MNTEPQSLPIHIGFPQTPPLVSAQLTEWDKAFIEKMRRECPESEQPAITEKPLS